MNKLFLRARDENRTFSSLKELVRGGLRKEKIEICSPDLYLRIKPMEEIFITSEDKNLILKIQGSFFRASLMGLTANTKIISFDSLKDGFYALLMGVIDCLQLHEMNNMGCVAINYNILFLKQEVDSQIQFSSGDSNREPERFILTWVPGVQEGKIADFRPLPHLLAVKKVPKN